MLECTHKSLSLQVAYKLWTRYLTSRFLYSYFNYFIKMSAPQLNREKEGNKAANDEANSQ